MFLLGVLLPLRLARYASHQSMSTFCPNGLECASSRYPHDSVLHFLVYSVCSHVIFSERFSLFTIFKKQKPPILTLCPLSLFCFSLLKFHHITYYILYSLTVHPYQDGSFMRARIFVCLFHFILCYLRYLIKSNFKNRKILRCSGNRQHSQIYSFNNSKHCIMPTMCQILFKGFIYKLLSTHIINSFHLLNVSVSR